MNRTDFDVAREHFKATQLALTDLSSDETQDLSTELHKAISYLKRIESISNVLEDLAIEGIPRVFKSNASTCQTQIPQLSTPQKATAITNITSSSLISLKELQLPFFIQIAIKSDILAASGLIKSTNTEIARVNHEIEEQLEKKSDLLKHTEAIRIAFSEIFTDSKDQTSIKKRIDNYVNTLFDGDDSIQEKIDSFYKNISAYSQELFEESDTEQSIKNRIDSMVKVAKNNNTIQADLIENLQKHASNISNLTTQAKNLLDDSTEVALAKAFKVRHDEFKTYVDRFDNLFRLTLAFALIGLLAALVDITKINQLECTFTSSILPILFGLIGMFYQLKANKDKSNQLKANQDTSKQDETNQDTSKKDTSKQVKESVLPALAVLIMGVFLGIVCNLLISLGLYIPQNFESLFITSVVKAPILGLLIWLSTYLSTRRNEYLQLQQEYAHKHSIALSFRSFYEQAKTFEDLDPDKELQKKLFSVMTDMLAHNPSSHLGKSKIEPYPTNEYIESVKNLLSVMKKENSTT